jgi:hypothetical protein
VGLVMGQIKVWWWYMMIIAREFQGVYQTPGGLLEEDDRSEDDLSFRKVYEIHWHRSTKIISTRYIRLRIRVD